MRKSEEKMQEEFELFMMRYKPEFRDFNKIGESTYANNLTSIAFDCWYQQQVKIDDLEEKIEGLNK